MSRLPLHRRAGLFAAVAVAVAGALPAHAADIVTKITSFGALSTPVSLTYGTTFTDADPSTAGIQLTGIGTLGALDRFYEDYAFTITDATFSTLAATIDLGSTFGLSNLQARLFQGQPQASLGTLVPWADAPLATGNTGNVTVISAASLAPGSYVLELRGSITGTSGGSYAGVLNLSPVAPIPEPGTMAMLLAGLGVVAFTARRRV